MQSTWQEIDRGTRVALADLDQHMRGGGGGVQQKSPSKSPLKSATKSPSKSPSKSPTEKKKSPSKSPIPSKSRLSRVGLLLLTAVILAAALFFIKKHGASYNGDLAKLNQDLKTHLSKMYFGTSKFCKDIIDRITIFVQSQGSISQLLKNTGGTIKSTFMSTVASVKTKVFGAANSNSKAVSPLRNPPPPPPSNETMYDPDTIMTDTMIATVPAWKTSWDQYVAKTPPSANFKAKFFYMQSAKDLINNKLNEMQSNLTYLKDREQVIDMHIKMNYLQRRLPEFDQGRIDNPLDFAKGIVSSIDKMNPNKFGNPSIREELVRLKGW